MSDFQICFLITLQGGDLPNLTDTGKPRLYLLQWLKSDRALMMLFNDGTFQVSFLSLRSLSVLLKHMFLLA